MKELTRYEFQNADIGVMSEILLPKKIAYQGLLFKSLEYALGNKFSFNNYFKKNTVSVEKLLKNYDALKEIKKVKLDTFDSKFRRIFLGYSMYEVDGVYKLHKPALKKSYVEERTQVLRCYFIPNYIEIAETNSIKMETLKYFSEIYFMASKITSYDDKIIKRKLSIYYKENKKILSNLKKKEFNHLYEYFKDWTDAVALFVFGFIIHEITLKLEKLKYKEGIKESESMEEEIWVTTHWGAIINRTIFKK